MSDTAAPIRSRDGFLIGAVLVAVGANGMGTDMTLWTQTPPLYWLLMAAGGWLVLRR